MKGDIMAVNGSIKGSLDAAIDKRAGHVAREIAKGLTGEINRMADRIVREYLIAHPQGCKIVDAIMPALFMPGQLLGSSMEGKIRDLVLEELQTFYRAELDAKLQAMLFGDEDGVPSDRLLSCFEISNLAQEKERKRYEAKAKAREEARPPEA